MRANKKKLFSEGFNLNSFVFIFAFLIFAMVLTWVVPAGQYDRITNELGQEVAVSDSFHYVEQQPVTPIGMFTSVVDAFREQADIIFCILFAYCFMGILTKSGVFDTLIKIAIRRLKDNVRLMLPVITIMFALMGSLAGLAEETFGLFPICISLAVAIGYDEIVGGSIVYLAVFTGFASATFNPYTIGVAQAIAEVPLYSGLLYRILCFIVFVGILIIYVMRYANKIKKDPTKSYLYDPNKKREAFNMQQIQEAKLTPRQAINLTLLTLTLVMIVTGALLWGWYIPEIAALFLAAAIFSGIIAGWSPNKIADSFVENGAETMFSLLVIGLSNSVCVVLTKGNITDTIVHGMANILSKTSGVIGAISMLIVQNFLNLFIPSGPGQAAVSMPIMTPLADVIGLSRQTAVLAFQFGDGYSNIFWPTMVFMMCGIMKIPINKWYKYMAPLFGIMFVAQVVLISLAVVIGY